MATKTRRPIAAELLQKLQAPTRAEYQIFPDIINYGRLMQRFPHLGYKYLKELVEIHKAPEFVAAFAAVKYDMEPARTFEARCAQLKQAAIDAYEVNPGGIILKCVGGAANRGDQFLTNLHNEIGGGEESVREDLLRDMSLFLRDRYVLQRRAERGLLASDYRGQTLAQVRADDDEYDRAASTDILLGWDPATRPFVGYIKAALKLNGIEPSLRQTYEISHASLDDLRDRCSREPYRDAMSGEIRFATRKKEETEVEMTDEPEARHKEELTVGETSESRLREGFGAEVGVEEETVHETDGNETMREIADDERYHRSESAAERARSGEDLLTHDAPDGEEEENADGPSAQEIWDAEMSKGRKVMPSNYDLATPQRADLKLIAEACEKMGLLEMKNELTAAASTEARNRVLKEATAAVVAISATMEDRETVTEALQDWDPGKHSLDTWLPEVRVHLEKATPTLSSTLTAFVQPQQMDLPMDMGLSPEERAIAAEFTIKQKKLWRTHSTPEVLGGKPEDRLDFQVLAHGTSVDLTKLPDKKWKRVDTLRGLARSRIHSTIDMLNSETIANEIITAIDNWNPEQNFWSEAVYAKIMEMNERGIFTPEQTPAALLYQDGNKNLSAEERTAMIAEERAIAAARKASLNARTVRNEGMTELVEQADAANFAIRDQREAEEIAQAKDIERAEEQSAGIRAAIASRPDEKFTPTHRIIVEEVAVDKRDALDLDEKTTERTIYLVNEQDGYKVTWKKEGLNDAGLGQYQNGGVLLSLTRRGPRVAKTCDAHGNPLNTVKVFAHRYEATVISEEKRKALCGAHPPIETADMPRI